MTFASPQILWLALVILPALATFFWWAWEKKKKLIGQFVRSRLLANLTVGVSARRQKIKHALLVVAVACVLLALARPQWGFAWEEAHQRGLDIVVAIDTSRSMLAADVPPNRLTRAKLAALDLMKQAQSDRLGLVAFAGSAFLQCPLTLDEEAFRQSVNTLEPGIIPQGGTALTEAIQTAAKAFKDDGDNHRILVLFTDGEDHEEGAIKAAEEAAADGLRIFTVGVGTQQGELIRVIDENGTANYVKDDSGNAVKSHLDETLLQQIATKANGFYLHLQGAKPMETLYQRGLAPLPKGDISSKLIKHFHERYHWPLSLAILLLLAEMFFPERRMVRKSEEIVKAANPQLRKAVAALLLISLATAASASPASAMRKYEEGRYEEALREYKNLSEKQPTDPRLHYNAGASAYHAGDYDVAAREFSSALASPGLDLQQSAYYNLGNSLYRLGEKLPEPDKKMGTWEQAVDHYESALKLNPNDPDAKFNLDLVKKKLEQLKKQQQQQNKSKDSDKKDQQKDDKKDQNQKQQNKDNKSDKDQKNSEQQKDKDQQKQQQAKNDQKKQDEKKDDQQGQKNQPDKDKDKSGADQAKKGASQKDRQTNAPPDQSMAAANGKMTPQQAKQMLDAQKDEEKALIFLPPDRAKSSNRTFKDW